ncbi:MAG: outer membrane lipoprotein carrier protein LolA [Spirochaetaceae bacterium]|nr:outer membrane lipoprotein carrier protein LolA [Spirochaetaceae bacterium]
MKKAFALCFSAILFCTTAFCQDILTAGAFFQSVSEYYGTLSDYESSISIIDNKSKEMTGRVSFKRPNLMRIDFSKPDTQVICFNGNTLTVYLPDSRAIFNQEVSSSGSSTGANLATPQGLTLLSRYYSIAYETGPQAVALDEGNPEHVVKLLLSRKTNSEGFRTIKLAINPDTKLIRRIEATSVNYENFVFNFTNYALNQNIPDTRFIYDAPSSANTYNNFLYTE